MVSNWEPARSLVEDAVSGAKISPCLPALAVAHLPPAGGGPVCSRLTLLWYSLSPLFREWALECLRLELFMGKFSLSVFLFFFFSLSLWLSQFGLLSHVNSLRLSSGHSGRTCINQCSPHLPVQTPLASGGHERLGYFPTGSCG